MKSLVEKWKWWMLSRDIHETQAKVDLVLDEVREIAPQIREFIEEMRREVTEKERNDDAKR